MPLWAEALIGVLASLALIVAATMRARRGSHGWRVEPLGAGQLRGDPDEVAVVYHENGEQLWFGGRRRGRGQRDVLEVPSREAWDAAVEPWARGRRAEILERVRGNAYVRRRVELVDQER